MSGPVRPSRETIGERSTKHGHTADRKMTPEYRTWANMIARCTNPRASHFDRYGGRGIKVCERWNSFENFLADMGSRPSLRHSLDRWPDVHGNYESGNCRWATHREQCRNRSSNRAVVRDDGLRFATMAEAADATGGNRRCIRDVCTGRQKSHLGHTWSYSE
ncbi:hypothetical protein FB007_10931 [Sinorhizobium medicae]|nr:hypothetical protein FB007_10931 [Sinorhizobium medicae]